MAQSSSARTAFPIQVKQQLSSQSHHSEDPASSLPMATTLALTLMTSRTMKATFQALFQHCATRT
ncbi:UPF0052 domain protein [Histoplasma capsulatum]|uniref:UPF0052 domain protein n=1 Tax=Ajellomyces capsulatus TaxID=5037 RepID=A0A8A1MK47_AJECA|nr:UPF0052 domain protein [Histoplasma capsulatum]